MLVGPQIKKARERRVMQSKELAERCDWSASIQSRIESNDRGVTADELNTIARVLGVRADDILNESLDLVRPLLNPHNPKPIGIDSLVHDQVYVLTGNDEEPLDITAEYSHEPYAIPREVKPHYSRLAREIRKAAEDSGKPYHNGPCVRLIDMVEDRHQLAGGDEAHGVKFTLGPVSWDEYSVMHRKLDWTLPDSPLETIRSKFGGVERIFTTGDLFASSMTHIMSVNVVVITKDGFGIIQLRSSNTQVSEQRYSGSINENMHRYLDLSASRDLKKRLHPLMTRKESETKVDYTYNPGSAVPSPYITAWRGLWEEVSVGMYEKTYDDPERLKFLNVVFGLVHCQPVLVGVLEVPFTVDECRHFILTSKGKDHHESVMFEYLPLDIHDRKTRQFISNSSLWSVTGLSAFISAMNYWRARQRAI